MKPSTAKRMTAAMPNYPGRRRAERVVRPIVERVGAGWVSHEVDRQLLRLVGYHAMWHALRADGVERPDLELYRRGIVKRRTAYALDEDFEAVFGAPVHALSREQVLRAMSAGAATDPVST
jgi:hypothetical protein